MKIKFLLLILFCSQITSQEIEDFDNILHVRPIKIERKGLTCNNCITTTCIVLNPIRTTEYKISDTLTVRTGSAHYINEYSTNIYDISNDYLIVYNEKFNNETKSHFFSFSIGDQMKDAMIKDDLRRIDALIGDKKKIYLIENKDSTSNSYFPDFTKISGHRFNWLKYRLTEDYIDTNLFDYISLDLLEYYLDSLDSKP